MPTITAQIVMDKNGFKVYAAGPPETGDWPLVTVEYMMDDAVDIVNSDADINIPYMSGTAGSKTLSLTGRENAAFTPLMAAVLRENKKTSLSNSSSTNSSSSTGSSIGLGGLSMSQSGSMGSAISATSAINNAANSAYKEVYDKAILRLREIDVSRG